MIFYKNISDHELFLASFASLQKTEFKDILKQLYFFFVSDTGIFQCHYST